MPKANVDLKEQSMNDGRWHRGASMHAMEVIGCMYYLPNTSARLVSAIGTWFRNTSQASRHIVSSGILPLVRHWRFVAALTAVELVGLRT